MSTLDGTVSNDKSIVAANRVHSFARGAPGRTDPHVCPALDHDRCCRVQYRQGRW